MKQKNIRLQFDATPIMHNRLETIRDRLEAGSISEVIRRAVRLLDAVTSGDEEQEIVVMNKTTGEKIKFQVI